MDLVALDRRASAATGTVIDRVPADLHAALTPCTQWTVRQVIKHMVDNNRHFVREAVGMSTVEGELAFDETSGEFTAAFGTEQAGALRIEVPRLRSSFDGTTIVAIHFVDVLIHGWDIGRAAGIEVVLDDELASAALAIAARYPDTPVIRGPGGAFAAPREVPDDAPAQDRLLALLGRDPAWSPAGDSWAETSGITKGWTTYGWVRRG